MEDKFFDAARAIQQMGESFTKVSDEISKVAFAFAPVAKRLGQYVRAIKQEKILNTKEMTLGLTWNEKRRREQLFDF